MKKINSNAYAGKWILAGLSMVAISCGIRAADGALDLCLPPAAALVPLVLGVILLAGFCLLLAVELRQDKRLNACYLKEKRTKIPLGDGLYECQTCGHQRVRGGDRSCPACGVTFTK